MPARPSPILRTCRCALLLCAAGIGGPAAAQARVSPIDLAAPQARALDEPAASAPAVPSSAAASAVLADRPASEARAEDRTRQTGVSVPQVLGGVGVIAIIAAIAALLHRSRRKRRG